MTKKIPLMLASMMLLASISVAPAQVSLVPDPIVLKQNVRFGELEISNPGDAIKEVEIDFRYTYPKADTAGKKNLFYGDSATKNLYSLSSFLRAFPRKFVMPPNTDQIVKILLKNDQSLDDGTYFTRLVVRSKNQKKQIDTSGLNPETIRASVEFVFEMLLPVFYLKGRVSAAGDFKGVETRVDSSVLKFFYSVVKSGNSPLLCNVVINIFDEGGNLVDTKHEGQAFYVNDRPAFDFDKSKFRKGKYKVELIMNNEREYPQGFDVPFKPVSRTFEITLGEEFDKTYGAR